MYQDTNNHMDTHPEVWNAIPVIGRYKNELAQLIEQIKTTAREQEQAQVFIGQTQRDLKKQIADKMDILDDILESYAEDQEKPELLAKVSNSYSDYFKLPNEDFETKI